jgi:hypothetical protein
MSVHWERLTADNLDRTVSLWSDRLTYSDDEFRRAVTRAAKLLREGRAFGALVLERECVRGFGLTAFVRDDVVDRLLTTMTPQLGKLLLLGRAPGAQAAILDRAELARGNAGRGLSLVVLNSNYDVDSDDAVAVLGCIISSFQAVHQGYRLSRIINEAHGEHNIEVVETSRAFDTCYLVDDTGGVRGFRSLVGSLTREAAAVRTSPLLGMFVYAPPRIGFSIPEQDLLQQAMSGAPDTMLAAKLDVATSAVKARWRRIVQRALSAVPELFDGLPAPRRGRGLQVRHLVLEYVRQHPSELTPYEGRTCTSTVEPKTFA